eukprot:GFKZ01010339.1.p1 GENE.GFKZ01010339.1~~GFKZ01010339.1.p1  ORF type:complete len:711 (+),score=111.59 GFKZ01010339.1:104-2236(+)
MGSRRSRRSHGRVQPAFPSATKRTGLSAGVTKASRLNQRAQKKAARIAAAKASREKSASQPPLLVALLSVSGASDEKLQTLAEVLRTTEVDKKAHDLETFVIRRGGYSERDVFIAALDAAKVADILLLVFGGNQERMDDGALQLVTAMREQGMPSVFAVAIGDEGADPALRKMRGRVLAAESLGEDHALRPVHVELQQGENVQKINQMAVRRILGKQPRCVAWRKRYGYLKVEEVETTGGSLRLRGWVRGRGLSANELIHVTGFGSFGASQIISSITREVLSARVSTEAEPVESEAEVDQLMGEQTWPPEVGEDQEEEEEAEGERMAREFDDLVDNGADNPLLTSKGENEDQTMLSTEEVALEEDDEMDGEGMIGDDDHEMSIDEEDVRRVRQAARDDALFPDEVDTPMDQAARVRFARYRGLKSLRTGDWDPKEQLPRTYATLFQFRNLAATKKRVLAEAGEVAKKSATQHDSNFARAGQFVDIDLMDVPADTQRAIAISCRYGCGPLVASGMLRHENRRSVVHFGLRRVDGEEERDIKAKSHLELHCGFVRFDGRPMFSEHNANSDKHKMERFLRHGRYTVASFYGPAIYAPTPALLCHPGGSLIATGSTLGADPDRIILKRIILTGYPFKTQKRRAVVKFMFFNPEDVRWFKPVELWTKMGRTGHILEPLGTHGHMKCIFDNVVLHHDTICMTLYKRVFPKLVGQEE